MVVCTCAFCANIIEKLGTPRHDSWNPSVQQESGTDILFLYYKASKSPPSASSYSLLLVFYIHRPLSPCAHNNSDLSFSHCFNFSKPLSMTLLCRFWKKLWPQKIKNTTFVNGSSTIGVAQVWWVGCVHTSSRGSHLCSDCRWQWGGKARKAIFDNRGSGHVRVENCHVIIFTFPFYCLKLIVQCVHVWCDQTYFYAWLFCYHFTEYSSMANSARC